MTRRSALRDRPRSHPFAFGPQIDLLSGRIQIGSAAPPKEVPPQRVVEPKAPPSEGAWPQKVVEPKKPATSPPPGWSVVEPTKPAPSLPWEERPRSPRSAGVPRFRVPLAFAVVAVLVAATAWAVIRAGSKAPVQPGPGAGSPGPYVSLAWAVRDGRQPYVAVLVAPVGAPPVAVLIPPETMVGGPGGGPRTVGEASADPAQLLVATQSSLERWVQRSVVMQGHELSTLVDQLGGIGLEVDEAFSGSTGIVQPGHPKLNGADVLAYLRGGFVEDRQIRWSEVVTGVLAGIQAAAGDPDPWASTVREPGAFAAAADAVVLELPTRMDEEGNTWRDGGAVEELITDSFGSNGALVRVIILNGIGRPGVGADVATVLAPHGFWAVASQNATSFDIAQTEIIAGSDEFADRADQVRAILGAGTVYVGRQATGVADITIVVGEDLAGI